MGKYIKKKTSKNPFVSLAASPLKVIVPKKMPDLTKFRKAKLLEFFDKYSNKNHVFKRGKWKKKFIASMKDNKVTVQDLNEWIKLNPWIQEKVDAGASEQYEYTDDERTGSTKMNLPVMQARPQRVRFDLRNTVKTIGELEKIPIKQTPSPIRTRSFSRRVPVAPADVQQSILSTPILASQNAPSDKLNVIRDRKLIPHVPKKVKKQICPGPKKVKKRIHGVPKTVKKAASVHSNSANLVSSSPLNISQNVPPAPLNISQKVTPAQMNVLQQSSNANAKAVTGTELSLSNSSSHKKKLTYVRGLPVNGPRPNKVDDNAHLYQSLWGLEMAVRSCQRMDRLRAHIPDLARIYRGFQKVQLDEAMGEHLVDEPNVAVPVIVVSDTETMSESDNDNQHQAEEEDSDGTPSIIDVCGSDSPHPNVPFHHS